MGKQIELQRKLPKVKDKLIEETHMSPRRPNSQSSALTLKSHQTFVIALSVWALIPFSMYCSSSIPSFSFPQALEETLVLL